MASVAAYDGAVRRFALRLLATALAVLLANQLNLVVINSDSPLATALVFALILGGSADGFDSQARDGNADVVIVSLEFGFGFHVVRIVKNDAALFEGADMTFVGMLVKSEQHVSIIT